MSLTRGEITTDLINVDFPDNETGFITALILRAFLIEFQLHYFNHAEDSLGIAKVEGLLETLKSLQDQITELKNKTDNPATFYSPGITVAWPVTNPLQTDYSLDDSNIIRMNGYEGALPDLSTNGIYMVIVNGAHQYLSNNNFSLQGTPPRTIRFNLDAAYVNPDETVGEKITSTHVVLSYDAAKVPGTTGGGSRPKMNTLQPVTASAQVRTLALGLNYESRFKLDGANQNFRFDITHGALPVDDVQNAVIYLKKTVVEAISVFVPTNSYGDNDMILQGGVYPIVIEGGKDIWHVLSFEASKLDNMTTVYFWRLNPLFT